MQLLPIKAKKPSLAARATQALESYILGANLAPGQFLPTESALCKGLGVGRSSLREALGILESQGLIERRHGVGLCVATPSSQPASGLLRQLVHRKHISDEDMFGVRLLLECETARLAAERRSMADLDRLQEAVRAMEDPGVSDEDYLEADYEFHRRLAVASQNKVFVIIMEVLKSYLLEKLARSTLDIRRPEQVLHLHRRILESVEAQDANAATNAMREHLMHARDMLR